MFCRCSSWLWEFKPVLLNYLCVCSSGGPSDPIQALALGPKPSVICPFNSTTSDYDILLPPHGSLALTRTSLYPTAFIIYESLHSHPFLITFLRDSFIYMLNRNALVKTCEINLLNTVKVKSTLPTHPACSHWQPPAGQIRFSVWLRPNQEIM